MWQTAKKRCDCHTFGRNYLYYTTDILPSTYKKTVYNVVVVLQENKNEFKDVRITQVNDKKKKIKTIKVSLFPFFYVTNPQHLMDTLV